MAGHRDSLDQRIDDIELRNAVRSAKIAVPDPVQPALGVELNGPAAAFHQSWQNVDRQVRRQQPTRAEFFRERPHSADVNPPRSPDGPFYVQCSAAIQVPFSSSRVPGEFKYDPNWLGNPAIRAVRCGRSWRAADAASARMIRVAHQLFTHATGGALCGVRQCPADKSIAAIRQGRLRIEGTRLVKFDD